MSAAYYMDVNVSMSITTGLRRRGIDVVTSQEDGTRSDDDEVVLTRATDLHRVLVSHDSDMRSSRGGAMIRSRTDRRRLPPLQTGRADFPHPAYPRTLRSKACADRCRLGRRTETLPRNEVGRSLFWEQRSMCILTLLHVESLAGPLRSTGITPLHHYYEPLRLPIEPRRSYGFPRLVDVWPAGQASLDRVSQVPDDSVGIRCPLPPRRARSLQTSVASRPMTGFTLSGRAGHSQTRNEAVSGSRFRITADAFAFRGSDRRITPTAAQSATWRTNNYHGQYLSTDKNRQALPDAPDYADFADLRF
jgi:hypothetical protein